MKNSSNSIRFDSLRFANAQIDLHEVNKFLITSHQIFDKKLSVIEEKMIMASSQKERDLLKQKVLHLYNEYKETLTLIEDYIHQIADRTELMS